MDKSTDISHKESRVKKTWLNARANLIFYFITLGISFFSRKIFLECLGNDFIGLTGTLNNLLGFLNIAELGIGASIGFQLYKPLYNSDKASIIEIVSVLGYLYRWIGIIILGGGLILGAFLPLIFPDRDTHLHLGIIYFAYFTFLISSLIGYFINYRQVLLGADQRYYVITKYYQSANVAKILIQIALAWYTKNLYLWIAIEFIFGFIYSLILNWKINKVYPWLKTNLQSGKDLLKKYPEVMKHTRQIFFHKIGSFSQFQITPILIYAFVSLATVAFYQNYTTIMRNVTAFFSNFFSGINGSIGNLIAEGERTRILNVFWELMSLNFFITGLICVPSYLLIDRFIIIWLGEAYVLPNLTLILILIPVFISGTRGVVDSYLNGHGMFWDTWAPLVETLLLVIVCVVGGHFYGLNGVLMGPIVSLIAVILIWKPLMLFHWGLKKNVLIYWLTYIKNSICIAVAMIPAIIVSRYVDLDGCSDFLEWVWCAIPVFSIYALSSYIIFLIFSTGMKSFNSRIAGWINRFTLKRI